VVSFHLAYEFAVCAPLILLFLFCVFRLAHTATRQEAMYLGWILGLLIYGPQLAFFWTIFGFGAVALWMVLATWLAVYLVLQRFALLKLSAPWAALSAPVLWTGVEYFRSELYPLKFSWLNAGYVFAPYPEAALLRVFGMYGVGFVLMLFAAQLASPRRIIWAAALVTFVVIAHSFITFSHMRWAVLKIAGVQLEMEAEDAVLKALDSLKAEHPRADVLVLSEYAFESPVPQRVKDWCAQNQRYLIAGGKRFLDAAGNRFHNTAFVIGPDGKEIFSQVKSVPVQFFKDGEPAPEQKLWHSPWGKIGLCVCYDLSYTRVTDKLVRQGAQAIIAPTMDQQSWGAREHRLHAHVAPVRATEYGIPIFRLCSSGISQAVNSRGTVLATAPFPGQGATLEATLSMPYRGSLPLDRLLVWLCVAISIFVFGWHIADSWRTGRKRASPANA
jgi:apolipoprotein N-acyltransferase